jgi:myo-inositol-1(or 4)-monophosphatase
VKYTEELHTARAAATEAGALIAKRWRSGATAGHLKGTIDVVTEVDLAAEALIVTHLSAAFPADRIVAEEGTGDPAAAWNGRCWLVDPLDGTTNFSHGIPHFCVSIALLVDGEPQVAVVHDPLRPWTFWARRSGGAWRDDLRLSVSRTSTLRAAVVATGFPYDRHTNPAHNLGRTGAVLPRVQGFRRAGSAALDLAWVAAGWLDAYWEERLKPWDVAAGVLLVTEAGGQVSNLLGGPLVLAEGRLTASNGLVHDDLIAVLARAPLVLELPDVEP